MRVMAMMLGVACAPAAANVSYEGEARDVESGKLLYEEHHLLRREADVATQRLVLYRCPAGQLFARKQVDYGATPAAPSFTLDDGRFGYREGVRRDGDALQAFVRDNGDSAERSATIAPSARLVIDAGFDEFVRANWDALTAGETQAVEFVVPSRLDALGFKLRRVDQIEIDGATASRFRLSLGGVIGWFAPDIDVSYRDSDRRLMRFEGLTNVRADREDNLVARIDFPPARSRDGVDAAAWDAALAEPLTDCRPGG
jgi:hypothetical protein